jgi:chromosome segregation ATPase
VDSHVANRLNRIDCYGPSAARQAGAKGKEIEMITEQEAALHRIISRLESDNVDLRARMATVEDNNNRLVGNNDYLARENEQLRAELSATREALEDKRRLTRLLDEALHGEGNAAEQASLCDLIEPAKQLRAERNALERISAWKDEVYTDRLDAVARAVKDECAGVAAMNYKHVRGGGIHISDVDVQAIISRVTATPGGARKKDEDL